MSKYKSENPTFRKNGQIYRVNSGKNKAIFTHQTGKIIEQIERALTWYKRVFAVVFDLRVKVFTLDNLYIKKLLSKLRFYLKKNYKIELFGYSWCREQYKASKQHYHMALMLDGAKINYPHKLLNNIQRMWAEITFEGSLYTPKNCYYMIHRNKKTLNDDTKEQAIYRISYQAKVKSKEKNTARANDYGVSQLKLNSNLNDY